MNQTSTTKFHILCHPISAQDSSAAVPEQPAAAPENSGTPAGGGARRGRPTIYSDRVLAMMKDLARRLGFSDTAAAQGVGVSSSTISRWKKETPEIGHELQQARQECRIHHLERIMKFAEGDDNRGLRATMWLLERLFPGDYAPRMAERFAHRNFEDRAREREDAELQMEREREAKAEREARAAEAQEKYLAVLAAYEAEIARNAGAASRTESEPAPVAADVPPREVEWENGASASESDSRNSRNAGTAESQPVAEGADFPDVRECQSNEPTEASHFHSEADSQNSRNAADPEEGSAAPISFTASETDSHNSRNSPPASQDPARVPSGLTSF